MKVGIITFHFVNNFGGALQAYSLKTACESLGVEAHLIDYRQWFICFTDGVRMFPICKNPKVFASGLRTFYKRVGRRRKFKSFSHKYLSLSKKYSCSKAIEMNPPGYDVYICGSDQIWNPIITCGISRAYFLTFEKNVKKKIAYAPSFGSSEIPTRVSRSIGQYVKQLGAVSVREREGADIVERLTGIRPVQLIDPSFLIPTEKWNELADKSQYEPPYDKYILVYIMQADNTVYEYARRIKEKYNIPVIEIGRYGYKAPFVDKCVVDLGPIEFINLFKKATHVCTNSYHGIIFSIIFEKKLCIIPCKRFKSRINNLLDLTGIKLPEKEEYELDVLYDIETVRRVILEQREKAYIYLKHNLGLESSLQQ